MSDETIKIYYQMWCEAWKLIRKWMANLSNTDEYSKAVIDEANAFTRSWKQKGCGTFAMSLMSDVINELVELQKDERNYK